MEHLANIKFCYKLGNVGADAGVQEGRREQKMCLRMVRTLREGKETTEGEPHSGRPSTSTTPEIMEKMRQMLT